MATHFSHRPVTLFEVMFYAARGVEHDFKQGDWAVAEMRRHPLKGDRGFYAELTQFITFSD
ncbi:hypothetical protein H0Z13_26760, partial [Klebsiella aerogenes]|nr:hypothetical protein [Klebsiella aerogenes]